MFGVILQWAIVLLVLYLALQILRALFEAVGHVFAAIGALLSAIVLLYLFARLYAFAAGHVTVIQLPPNYQGVLDWILENGDAIIEWFKDMLFKYVEHGAEAF